MSASEGLEKARDGGLAGGILSNEPCRRDLRLLSFETSAILIWQRRDSGLGGVLGRRCLSRRVCSLVISSNACRAYNHELIPAHEPPFICAIVSFATAVVSNAGSSKPTAPRGLTHIVAPDFLRTAPSQRIASVAPALLPEQFLAATWVLHRYRSKFLCSRVAHWSVLESVMSVVRRVCRAR